MLAERKQFSINDSENIIYCAHTDAKTHTYMFISFKFCVTVYVFLTIHRAVQSIPMFTAQLTAQQTVATDMTSSSKGGGI